MVLDSSAEALQKLLLVISIIERSGYVHSKQMVEGGLQIPQALLNAVSFSIPVCTTQNSVVVWFIISMLVHHA